MHHNPSFRKAKDQQNIKFVRKRSFGALTINGDNGPLISHIPFQLSEDGMYVEAHLVRSNPILSALRSGPLDAVIAVSGADGYISPDWYGLSNQVPTWNYVAVHLRGQLRVLPQEELHGILERLSVSMEVRLAPKPVWNMEKIPVGMVKKMMRMIVPIAFDVGVLEGTWKLGQNKPNAARLAAADGVSVTDMGLETDTLAALMKCPPC
jgi:transcriptional regulator